MKNIFKSFVKHPCTSLFTSNPSCTIHDDVSILVFFEHFFSHRQLFPECITWNFNRCFKASYFIFIMISHVNNQGRWVFYHFVESSCVYILSLVMNRKVGIFNSIGNNFFSYFNIKHIKGIFIFINCLV